MIRQLHEDVLVCIWRCGNLATVGQIRKRIPQYSKWQIYAALEQMESIQWVSAHDAREPSGIACTYHWGLKDPGFNYLLNHGMMKHESK